MKIALKLFRHVFKVNFLSQSQQRIYLFNL